MTPPRPPAWLALSLPVLAGAFVMARGGAEPSRAPNHIGSLALSVLVYVAVKAAAPERVRRLAPVGMGGAALLLFATLLSPAPPASGDVHRWLFLGPFTLQVSALVCPLLLVGAAQTVASARGATYLFLFIVQIAHLSQPDAGQATAFAAGILVLSAREPFHLGTVVLRMLLVAVTALSWQLPALLPPAPFAEDIVRRAFTVHPLVGALSMVSLVAYVGSPLLVRARSEGGTSSGAAALVAYFAATIVAASSGDYAVPLLGFGASSVLGTFLGVAALHASVSEGRVPGAPAPPISIGTSR